ncbi:MAG TPA: hypothetical protein VN932_12930 [Rhizomicrobium sp.]|nr:hypothetical protein [Rhizomicrobium sp.]
MEQEKKPITDSPRRRRLPVATADEAAQMVPLHPSPMSAFNSPLPELPVSAAPGETDGFAQTEDLLNGLIGECHYLMREVAFRSICQCSDPTDRVQFMRTAMEFAKTGAEVANAVVHLRGGTVVSETRQTIRVEHMQKTTTTGGTAGEGGAAPR